jgi:hypothetical protein
MFTDSLQLHGESVSSALCATRRDRLDPPSAAAEPRQHPQRRRKRGIGKWEVTAMPRALKARPPWRSSSADDRRARNAATRQSNWPTWSFASLDRQAVEDYAEKLFKCVGIGKGARTTACVLLWSKGRDPQGLALEVG